MSLPRQNPRIPEGINASEDNPLVEFAWLAATVLLGLAALVFVLSLTARWLAPMTPFSWEQRASGSLAQYFETGDGAVEAVAASAALQELANALLNSSLQVPIGSKFAEEVVPADVFRFHLVDSDVPNAFATLGANVAVTHGLLRNVQSENGLAMVIAHEIAHVQLRHPIESLGRGVALQLALSLVLGASDSGAVGGVLTSGGLLTLLSFNRDMELAADARALAILQAHYGHLAGADEFFSAMDAAGDDPDWLEFASTHPDTDRRLALLREAMRAPGAMGPVEALNPVLRQLAVRNDCAGQEVAAEVTGTALRDC